jgi:hypothetical protein
VAKIKKKIKVPIVATVSMILNLRVPRKFVIKEIIAKIKHVPAKTENIKNIGKSIVKNDMNVISFFLLSSTEFTI